MAFISIRLRSAAPPPAGSVGRALAGVTRPRRRLFEPFPPRFVLYDVIPPLAGQFFQVARLIHFAVGDEETVENHPRFRRGLELRA
ncbi:MAG: hypothetical protein LBJ46_04500 [Planctomycetota bacterium]|jgi:hypothetical protein|nr:hypothetical protein [Planctomycetota bacterium]